MSKEALEGLDQEIDRLFKANQEKLPKEDRLAEAGPTCSVQVGGFICTKAPHVSGDHVAHGRLGTVVQRWLS